jgi:hypothetical protein
MFEKEFAKEKMRKKLLQQAQLSQTQLSPARSVRTKTDSPSDTSSLHVHKFESEFDLFRRQRAQLKAGSSTAGSSALAPLSSKQLLATLGGGRSGGSSHSGSPSSPRSVV